MLFCLSRRSVRALGEGGLHESPSSRSVERRRVGVERGTARRCWLVPLHRHQLARNRLRSSIAHCARWVCVYSLIFLGNTLYSILYCPCTTEPPTIVVDRQIKQVSVGARVTLTCTSSSVPPPRFSWSKAGGALPRCGNIVQQVPTYESSIS